MRQRVALAAVGLIVIVAALMLVVQTRASRPGSQDAIDPSVEPPVRAISEALPEQAAPLDRNVFEYGTGRPEPQDSTPIPRPLAPPAPLVPPPPPRVRLIGLVTRANGLKAALSISGEVSIVGPGESSGGYAVLSIDEDLGVRLRDLQGVEIALPIDSAVATPEGGGGTHQPNPPDSPRT